MNDGPTGIWITDPTAYKKKLEALLGDRDPLAVLGETADILAGFVADHEPPVMQTRPFDGKWTPNEIIGHLVDA